MFCGVCGARLGSGTERVDDPGATTKLDGPAAETQPMRAAVVESVPAAEVERDAPGGQSDRPSDSMIRAIRPRGAGWMRNVAVTVLVIGGGYYGGRWVRGAFVSTPPAAPAPVAAQPAVPSAATSVEETERPMEIRPTARRVGRSVPRVGNPGGAGAEGGAAGAVGGESPYAQLDKVSPTATSPSPSTTTTTNTNTNTSTTTPTGVAGGGGAAAPAAGVAKEGLSAKEVEEAAQYMKGAPGDDFVPPSAEDLAERDRAEGFAGSIRMVVRAHAAQVSACYERAFKTDAPAHSARVEVGFTVDKGGMPTKVRAVSNNSGSDALANCLAQRVAGWRFPRPPGGDFDAVYPFTFSGAR